VEAVERGKIRAAGGVHADATSRSEASGTNGSVSSQYQRLGIEDAERNGNRQVDEQLKLDWLLDRQLSSRNPL
jgi:hypothetical protein